MFRYLSNFNGVDFWCLIFYSSTSYSYISFHVSLQPNDRRDLDIQKQMSSILLFAPER